MLDFPISINLPINRELYRAPFTNGYFLRDFDGYSRLRSVHFPSAFRRLTYHYAPDSITLFCDWSDVVLKIDATTSRGVSVAIVTDRMDEAANNVVEFEGDLVGTNALDAAASSTLLNASLLEGKKITVAKFRF